MRLRARRVSPRAMVGGLALQDAGLALLSGTLLVLCFPPFGYSATSWIALSPLLVALGRPAGGNWPRRGLVLGFLAGVVYFGGTVYWTGETVRTYGGLSTPVAVATASLLVAYLALFPTLFALTLAWLVRVFGLRALWSAPAVWVASEVARTYFWSGFPWLLLGYGQATVLPVAQLSSVLGVFGLSGLLVLVSSGLAFLALTPGRRGWSLGLAPVGLTLLVGVWGALRIEAGELVRAGDPLEVAVVQGNVPQDEKWDGSRAAEIFDRYLDLTRGAIAQGARLILWPESSTPFYFEEDRTSAERIRALVRESGVRLLLGSNEVVRDGDEARYHNAAFLVGPSGRTEGVYRKMRLVPFGEFVPLRSLLFFVAPLVGNVADFSPGESVVTLPLDRGQISTAICYEVVYPALVRAGVRRGSQLLTTITNDAWYGYSGAPHQHFLQASLRAVEEGRYLVRAANTGISGVVDPYGRVLRRSDLFVTTVLTAEVRLLSEFTVYARIGDLFAYLCVATTLALVAMAWRGPRRKERA